MSPSNNPKGAQYRYPDAAFFLVGTSFKRLMNYDKATTLSTVEDAQVKDYSGNFDS